MISINTRYQDILRNLYRFRFLTRLQLQHLLHHKQFNRIIIWLNYLTKSSYIKRYYNSKQVTVPAFYSLGLKARKYLKGNPEFPDIKASVLDRVWQEHTTSPEFKRRCMLVADVYLSLVALTEKTKATLLFKTQTDLHGVRYLILPPPDAFFAIKEKAGSSRGYFLDVFEEHATKAKLFTRIERYGTYYEANYWQDHAKDPFPNIILVCTDEWSYKYLFKTIQRTLNNTPDLNFYLTTRELIKTKGMSREVLQKVELPD